LPDRVGSEIGTADFVDFQKEPRQLSAAPSDAASYQRREQVEVRISIQ